MKRTINLLLILTSLAVASCNNSDGDIDVDDINNYTFGYTIMVQDIYGKNLLDENTKQVTIEPLSDKDKVVSKITTDEYGNNNMEVEIESFDTGEISMHSQVLTWEYESKTVTDTILCEIEKDGSVITCTKIWVNNHLKWDYEIRPATRWISLTKMSTEHIGLRDEKSTGSRVEKEIDGIKFVYWLSDMDGNETNLFDQKDVEKRGFNFNLSVTNNTNEPILFDNDALSFHGYVLGVEGYEVMRSCEAYADILFTYKVMPGETHYEKRWWCTSGYMDSQLLSSGKYYAYFYNRNFNLKSPEKEISIPALFINLEIK